MVILWSIDVRLRTLPYLFHLGLVIAGLVIVVHLRSLTLSLLISLLDVKWALLSPATVFDHLHCKW